MTIKEKLETSKEIITGKFRFNKDSGFVCILSRTFWKNGISDEDLREVIAPVLKDEEFCELETKLRAVPDGYSYDETFLEKMVLDKEKNVWISSAEPTYLFRPMNGLRKYDNSEGAISFDEHTCILMSGNKKITFRKQLKQGIIKKLWEERKTFSKKPENIKKQGTILSMAELAASIEFIDSATKFSDIKKNQFREYLKGIQRQIKKLDNKKISLQLGGGVQLITQE